MNNNNIFTFLFLMSLTVMACNTSGSQYLSNRPSGYDGPLEPGKCFAKCLIPDSYNYSSTRLPVYTGDLGTEQVNVETRKIVTQPATSKWVKQKSENCRSADPNDCLIWCLKKQDEIAEEYVVVLDTSQTANYKWIDIESKEVTKEGGYTEWREVVCANDVTPLLIHSIQDRLAAEGYFHRESNGNLDLDTKTALKEFQNDNNLPKGQLDTSTLAKLGVSGY